MSDVLSNFVYSAEQSYLFKRAYALAIGQPKQTSAIQFANYPLPGLFQPPSPLRITFDINKNTTGSSSNKSKIEIYNLSQPTRSSIKKGYILLLQVGYAGVAETLFTGNILPDGLKSARKQADIITTMECGDGESSITLSTLERAYPAGITLAQILTDVVGEMSLSSNIDPDSIDTGVAVGIPNIVYGRGKTISGPCRFTLDKLLKPLGLEWNVQNGNLNIIPKVSHNGQSAIVISSDTGMIGVPSQNDQYTEFISLLNPKLVPGQLVQLISENKSGSINGFYKVCNAHYEGDTHDTKWQVTCQCQPVIGVQQQLKAARGLDYDTAVS